MSNSKINGEQLSSEASAPRPSAAALLGSLLSVVGKETSENIAEREAADKARQRAIVVHSPHVLLDVEKDRVRSLGRDPSNYVGMLLQGSLQAVRNPQSGKTLLILACEIPPKFFPDLDNPMLLSDGTAATAKFDRTLGSPMMLRVVLEKTALGEGDGLRSNVELLASHEGKTFGELQDAGYQFQPGPRLA